MIKRAECPSYFVSIFIAGDADAAKAACRRYCDREGLCVTVTPTTYVYSGGEEPGVIVGLINYPRFPTEPREIEHKARTLAMNLCVDLDQQSYSIQTPGRTYWISHRPEDAA